MPPHARPPTPLNAIQRELRTFLDACKAEVGHSLKSLAVTVDTENMTSCSEAAAKCARSFLRAAVRRSRPGDSFLPPISSTVLRVHMVELSSLSARDAETLKCFLWDALRGVAARLRLALDGTVPAETMAQLDGSASLKMSIGVSGNVSESESESESSLHSPGSAWRCYSTCQVVPLQLGSTASDAASDASDSTWETI